MTERRIVRGAVAIVILGAALRLAAPGLHSLWLDEATSLQFARHDTRGCLLAEVNNPPLFRLLLHGWIRIAGDGSDAVLRLLPALLGVLTLIAFWPLARRLLPGPAALAALLLLALNPYHLLFSQELRAWSLLGLLTVLTFLCHLRSVDEPRPLRSATLTLVLTLGLYAHYQFAWVLLTVVAHRLWIGRDGWRRLVLLLLPVVVALVLFAPWIVVFAARVEAQQRGYTTDLLGRIASLPFMLLLGESAVVRLYPETYQQAAVRQLWLVVPFGAAFAPALVLGWRSLWRRPDGRLVLAWLGLPLVCLALLFAWLPLFTARYLSFTSGALCLLVAAALLGSRPWVGRLAVGGILALQLFSLGRYHLDPRFGREDWRGAARYVMQQEEPGAIILFDKHYVRIPFDRYYRGPSRLVPLPEDPVGRQAIFRRLRRDRRTILVLSHAWDTGHLSVRRLKRRLCHRRQRIFPSSNGIEVHVFGPCPGNRPGRT